MNILALDIGEKRIGVARGASDTRIAIPVGFVERDGLEWQKIGEMLKKYNIKLTVMGLPRSNSGVETRQSAYARHFADIFTKNFPETEITFEDETLTSVAAEDRLKERGRMDAKDFNKGEIDAEAATIILEAYFEDKGGNYAK